MKLCIEQDRICEGKPKLRTQASKLGRTKLKMTGSKNCTIHNQKYIVIEDV
jgi:hypothetical protein